MSVASEIGHNPWELSAEAVTAWAAVGALAFTAITAVIAAWAARIAIRQLRENRAISRDADAQESYRSYLEASLNNAELATPDFEKIKSNPHEMKRYDWFVAYLLAASEKILEIAVDDLEWITAIKLNVEYHEDLLLDKELFEDKQLMCYSIKLRKLIFEKTGRRAPEDDFQAWSKDKDELAGSAQ